MRVQVFFSTATWHLSLAKSSSHTKSTSYVAPVRTLRPNVKQLELTLEQKELTFHHNRANSLILNQNAIFENHTPLFAIRSVDFSCFSIVAGEDSPNI
jgi:hypothetical protein